MTYKFYTLDNHFIKEVGDFPPNFTGIVEISDGSKFWYFEGDRHRLDGPACEWYDGTRCWCSEGEKHRLDGPACEYPSGSKSWFVDGKEVTEEQCELLHSIMKLKGLL